MQEIASYIAVGWMEPQTAVKLLRALKKAIGSLDMFPGRIRPTPEEPWHSLGVRRLVVKNYYVYFWIGHVLVCYKIHCERQPVTCPRPGQTRHTEESVNPLRQNAKGGINASFIGQTPFILFSARKQPFIL